MDPTLQFVWGQYRAWAATARSRKLSGWWRRFSEWQTPIVAPAAPVP